MAQVSDVDISELGLVISDCLLGKVGLHKEVTISHEEEGVGLLYICLQGLLQVLRDLGEVTTFVQDLSEELFKCTLLFCGLFHIDSC